MKLFILITKINIMRTKGSGFGGGVILYQTCKVCGNKKSYYSPISVTFVPPFKCTYKLCKKRFYSDELIKKTYAN